MLETAPDFFYTIHTKAGKEREAARNLQQQGAFVFAPFTKNKRREIVPAFPRYIFAAFELDQMFAKLRSTRGVSTIVRFGDEFARVERDILRDLLVEPGKEFVDFNATSPRFRYAVGQVLLVTIGQWYGRNAVVADCYENESGVNEYLLDPLPEGNANGFNGLPLDPAMFRFPMHEKGVTLV